MNLSQSQIDRINTILEEEVPIKNWPIKGNKVWALNIYGSLTEFVWESLMKSSMKLSRIYQTEEAAQYAFDKQELLYELQIFANNINNGWEPDFYNNNESKFFIYYDYNYNEYSINTRWSECLFNQIWFKERNYTQNAIDKFGDRLELLK